MKARSRKPPHKPPRRQLPVAANPALLMDIIDELDLVDGMLRCVPQLQLVLQIVEAEGSNDLAHDPIGHWLEALGEDRPQEIEDHGALSESKRTLAEAPDAVVTSARWRLVRVRHLLEAARNSTHRKRG